MTTISLLKYEALGNDFLIALDPRGLTAGGDEVVKDVVVRLCERHRGVGADGLIVARPGQGGADIVMELHNADGGRAETSGNGLRCLALALVDAGVVASRTIAIETDGGPVKAVVGPQAHSSCAEVTVTMGRARVGGGAEAGPLATRGFAGRRVEIGNPHLVLIGPSLAGIEAAAFGPPLETALAGGQNVEAVSLVGPDRLELLVWERGAGATSACGSGSAAAAAAARAAGLVGDEVTVDNPGGTLRVGLAGPAEEPEVTLTGPACRVARVEVELEPGALR